MPKRKNDGLLWGALIALAFVIWLFQKLTQSIGGWGIAFIAAAILCGWLASRISRLGTVLEERRAEIASLESNLATATQTNAELSKRVDALKKYQGIADIEGHIARLSATADAERSDLLLKARTRLEQAEQKVNAAAEEGGRIIADAKKRAEEIAGEAWSAKERADEFRKTAEAMKNAIKGYGDEYLVPTYTLLDELAEDFSHALAGEELKKARERSRQMVKSGRAALCDYADGDRRETAVRFVTDAFNGKVDSILAKSKADNVGTLTQQIKDAFHLVNQNGTAFRNARIAPEYLASRLDELKWAVVAQELREQEREEQRRIKEEIREEERARREYEKAIRDAEKEEEMLRKAMEKVQAQVSKASDEQRAAFEAQLAELQGRLQAAEEKNQRALSMAQQTRTGHVYVISNIGSFGEEVFKIGMTRRLEPIDRIRELGDASVPFEFDVHALIYSEDAPGLEKALHRHFLRRQINKVNPRKEFFRLNVAEIRAEIEKLGIAAHWTMAAEARSYRETLRIEEQIAANPELAQEWTRHQMEIEAVEEAESESV